MRKTYQQPAREEPCPEVINTVINRAVENLNTCGCTEQRSGVRRLDAALKRTVPLELTGPITHLDLIYIEAVNGFDKCTARLTSKQAAEHQS